MGIFITAVSYALEPLFDCFQRRGYKQYTQLEWTTNATLQLHRLAHEEAGEDMWTNCTDTIPTTKSGNLLRPLDITDTKHPKLSGGQAKTTNGLTPPTHTQQEDVQEFEADVDPSLVIYGNGEAEVSPEDQGVARNANTREAQLPPAYEAHVSSTQVTPDREEAPSSAPEVEHVRFHSIENGDMLPGDRLLIQHGGATNEPRTHRQDPGTGQRTATTAERVH